MLHISVKEAVEKILSKSEKTSDLIAKMKKEDVHELQLVLEKLSKKIINKEEELSKPSAAATSIMNAFGGGSSPAPAAPAPSAPSSGSLASNITGGLNRLIGKNEECYKVSEHGQWKIEKQERVIDYSKMNKPKNIKPGPALDYSKPKSTAKPGPALDYSKPAKEIKPGSTVDYSKLPKPSKWDMSPEEKEAAKRRVSDTSVQMKAKYGVNAKGKSIGVNKAEDGLVNQTPEMDEKNTLEKPSMFSKDEPHKDDARHEEKEKNKAKQIKEDAQEILDLHKNGQWSLTKAKFISPEQQKLNRDKASKQANKDAFVDANIEVKEKQPSSEEKKKPVDKKHLTVIKEEDK